MGVCSPAKRGHRPLAGTSHERRDRRSKCVRYLLLPGLLCGWASTPQARRQGHEEASGAAPSGATGAALPAGSAGRARPSGRVPVAVAIMRVAGDNPSSAPESEDDVEIKPRRQFPRRDACPARPILPCQACSDLPSQWSTGSALTLLEHSWRASKGLGQRDDVPGHQDAIRRYLCRQYLRCAQSRPPVITDVFSPRDSATSLQSSATWRRPRMRARLRGQASTILATLSTRTVIYVPLSYANAFD
ncbi:hypothetical protein C8J57DRAFT_1236993 [Mycena rebaudengoi]|nr:hypothetical protein C8J57DRAFT_1236993 [Mycena rebaudengoi]